MNKGTAVSDEEFEKELNKYKSNSTEVGFQKMLQETSMSYDEWVQLKRENFTVTKFMKEGNVVATNLTPDEVQKYYDEHVDQFKRPESVHVRQIVTDTKEKAESILRRLQNGENFAKLARDLSLSPDRKDGGDLGFITRGSFPREFEVCFSMNPGEISPIIPSIYGFHLFKVLEKSPPKTLDIMEVHDKIVTQIKQKTLRSTLQSLLKELRVKTKIQINEDILKRITL
jgi:parvulin-like peptidyl-prolyl isomerase